jgi:hypothetical protein
MAEARFDRLVAAWTDIAPHGLIRLYSADLEVVVLGVYS